MPHDESTTPRHPMRTVVERTGLKPELIRAWERRHDAIVPRRTAGRHRLYSDADVERLRLLRDATDGGHAIGRIAALSDAELAALVGGRPAASASRDDGGGELDPRVEACVAAARRLDGADLSALLARHLVDLGPRRALSELVSPLVRGVGELWHRQRLRPMHEHLVTSAVRTLLDHLIERYRSTSPAPVLIAATPAGQRHEVGALLAATQATLDGWHVVFLGADLPSEEIAAAAREAHASAVALSVVHPPGDTRLGQELRHLRRQLGDEVPILVGGGAADAYADALHEAGTIRVAGLDELSTVLTRLRARVPPASGKTEETPPRDVPAPARDVPAPARDGWPVARRELFLSREARERYGIEPRFLSPAGTLLVGDPAAARVVAAWINERREAARAPGRGVGAAELHAAGVLQELAERLVAGYLSERDPDALGKAVDWLREHHGRAAVDHAFDRYHELFGPSGNGNGLAERPELTLERLWLLWLANHNPAFEPLHDLFDDRRLEAATGYGRLVRGLESFFGRQPGYGPDGESLFALLRRPLLAAPDSLAAQLTAAAALQQEISRCYVDALLRGLDVLREEQMPGFAGPPGPPPRQEWAAFAPTESGVPRPREESWMAEAVVVAKNVHVWLDQLSRVHGRDLRRLDEIPDAELERLAGWGFSGLWLVGLWERSPASERLKRAAGQADAAGSAYAVHEYRVAGDLGGEAACARLRERAAARGLVLACDFVPNHMGLDSPWVVEHPDRFLSVAECPFPSYAFTGEDLSGDPRVSLYLEDHYADQSDAAVVFRRLDRDSGEERYVYHGNDGTRLPWNDTAQLDYLNPDVRAAMITILVGLARRFPVIRIDAAMTLVREHVQRLWHPRPGQGGAIPSRAEHAVPAAEFDRRMPEEFWREAVARVAAEAPGTLLLAEGFWMLESYFIHQLGLHRVYNSAFMHLLRDEDNGRFRALLASVLEHDPWVLERFANFLTNPDEAPAAEQLGKGDKYFALATLLATLPGLPLFGHGQVEGLTEKYGMEYRRAKDDATPDAELVARHEREIVPLLERRRLFAHAGELRLYDVEPAGGGEQTVDDVLAFSNRDGQERVLVVVHNRRAHRRVRIRRAVPRRDRHGEPRTDETLGTSWGIEAAASIRFRELRGGRVHVWTGEELCERGVELELGPYDYRVFVS